MLPRLLSAVSTWVGGFKPGDQVNETLPNYKQEDIRRASKHASAIIICMRDFRHTVQEKFLHRVDAIAVVDQAEQILDEQHGGMDPYIFLRNVLNYKFGDLSPEERTAVEKLCQRWIDKVEVDREFSVFCPFDRTKDCHDRQAMSEERISEVTVFLERWIREQKGHAQSK